MHRHVVTARQFNKAEIEELISSANRAREGGYCYHPLKNKILATLFYQPSTRTRFSFESAMYRLGGNVLSSESASDFSSSAKGESLTDTIKVVSSYADIIVIRHPNRGAGSLAACYSKVSVINAGDGFEHPTQALLDLYTVEREFGKIDELTYCLVGDLKFGRTIHSLIYLLGLYKNIKLILVQTRDLALPDEVLNFIRYMGIECMIFDTLSKAIKEKPDVLYLTRLQREALSKSEVDIDYSDFVLTTELMDRMKEKSIVLHPLPRCEEIELGVDTDKRAKYFTQAENGLWMRMAILNKVSESSDVNVRLP